MQCSKAVHQFERLTIFPLVYIKVLCSNAGKVIYSLNTMYTKPFGKQLPVTSVEMANLSKIESPCSKSFEFVIEKG